MAAEALARKLRQGQADGNKREKRKRDNEQWKKAQDNSAILDARKLMEGGSPCKTNQETSQGIGSRQKEAVRKSGTDEKKCHQQRKQSTGQAQAVDFGRGDSNNPEQ
jgi:hypothetical protein